MVKIDGQAYIRQPSGSLLPVQSGDALDKGAVLVFDKNSTVAILLPNGELVNLGGEPELVLNESIFETPASLPGSCCCFSVFNGSSPACHTRWYAR